MQTKLFSHQERKGEAQQVESPSQPLEGHQQPAKTVNATYKMIGLILQGGVILSAVVVLVGLLLESLQPDKFASQKLQTFPQTFGQVWTGLLTLHPQAVITLGLLLLIATPVVRVAVSIPC